jgi:hypothetical protein
MSAPAAAAGSASWNPVVVWRPDEAMPEARERGWSDA